MILSEVLSRMFARGMDSETDWRRAVEQVGLDGFAEEGLAPQPRAGIAGPVIAVCGQHHDRNRLQLRRFSCMRFISSIAVHAGQRDLGHDDGRNGLLHASEARPRRSAPCPPGTPAAAAAGSGRRERRRCRRRAGSFLFHGASCRVSLSDTIYAVQDAERVAPRLGDGLPVRKARTLKHNISFVVCQVFAAAAGAARA